MYEFVTNSVTNLWIWWCVSYVWVCHTLIRTTHMIICMISRILCMISWLIHAHFMTHPYTQKDMSFLHEFVTHFICMSSWLIHIRNEAYHSCQANVYESVTFISMISWLIHAHKTTCRTAHAYTLVTYSCRQKEMTSTLWVTNSSKRNVKKKCQAHYESRVDTRTGWWRTIGCLKLQVSFRKSATNYRALLQKMIYKDAAFYGSSPPCKSFMPSKRNVKHAMIGNPPTPRGNFLFTMFSDPKPGGRGPPMKNHLQNWSILVVLQGGSSTSRFLIREHSKKETPPGVGASFDQLWVTNSWKRNIKKKCQAYYDSRTHRTKISRRNVKHTMSHELIK